MWLDYPGLSPDRIAAIGHPALVLAGDRDEIIPLDLSIALYRALPHAELSVSPFADHIAQRHPSAPDVRSRHRRLRPPPHHRITPQPPRKETKMLTNTKAYSGIAVHDMQQARQFYGETLGLATSEGSGLLWLHLAGVARHARL